MKLPRGSICSHMHIFDSRWPLKVQTYSMPNATVCHARTALPFDRLVIVQPSVYGTNNAALLDALDQFQGKAKGVVEVENDITMNELQDLAKRGVVGARLNLASSTDHVSDADLVKRVNGLAEIVKRMPNWVLDLHLHLDQLAPLKTLLPNLGIPIAIDHFGGPTFSSTSQLPEHANNLLDLLANDKERNIHVKISAPYRFVPKGSSSEAWQIFKPFFTELYKTAPERLVIASDWPNTRYTGTVDNEAWYQLVLEWCTELDGQRGVERLFRENAEKLWGFEKA